jgi:perosamine synthetase
MIPFFIPSKLSSKQLDDIGLKIRTALASGQITNGVYVKEFEEKIKELHNVEYVIACSSCTQGLYITLEALKPKFLSIQSFTWQVFKYILSNRQIITYCDIDKDTWLMDHSNLSAVGTTICTHTLGNTDLISENQKVIYDGAYSLGIKLPSIGEATIISTTASKTITSCEGGLILTNDKRLAIEATEIRDKCSRMSELNAIVGLAYLEDLHKIINRKKEIFEYYNKELPFIHQKESEWGINYGFYGCLIPNNMRDELMKKLEGKVDVRIRYVPLKDGYTVTDEISKQIMILPCYPDLCEKEVVRIIKEQIS